MGKEFGITPIDEVEHYFSDDPAVRRKVARKKKAKIILLRNNVWLVTA